MERRALGNTGLQVGRIALGTVKVGRNTGVKYPTAFELPTDAQVEALLAGALELGVNLLDTAPAYGTSEERLAPFLARHRADVVLCSKAGEDFDPATGASRHDFSTVALTSSVERSLRRLGTDHLDVLLLHSDGRDREILESTDAVATLDRLRAAGKIRATGISAHTSEGIALASEHLDVVMAPFSRTNPELGADLKRASAAGMGTMAIKVLDRGHLPRAGGVAPVAGDESDESPAAAALRHVLALPFVDTVVLGTLSRAHLEEAVRLAE